MAILARKRTIRKSAKAMLAKKRKYESGNHLAQSNKSEAEKLMKITSCQ